MMQAILELEIFTVTKCNVQYTQVILVDERWEG
jgi:hypothetical protein